MKHTLIALAFMALAGSVWAVLLIVKHGRSMVHT